MDQDDKGEDNSDEDATVDTAAAPDSPDTNIVTPDNFDTHMTAHTTHSNIPVQRLVQSIRQVGLCFWKTFYYFQPSTLMF